MSKRRAFPIFRFIISLKAFSTEDSKSKTKLVIGLRLWHTGRNLDRDQAALCLLGPTFVYRVHADDK
jgi:hypothetical protein